MVRSWSLNLENTGGKKGLKDPLGYKQNIDNMLVRQSRDTSRTTQVELYEKVSTYKEAMDQSMCRKNRTDGRLMFPIVNDLT